MFRGQKDGASLLRFRTSQCGEIVCSYLRNRVMMMQLKHDEFIFMWFRNLRFGEIVFVYVHSVPLSCFLLHLLYLLIPSSPTPIHFLPSLSHSTAPHPFPPLTYSPISSRLPLSYPLHPTSTPPYFPPLTCSFTFPQKSESIRTIWFNWNRETLEQKKQFFVDVLVGRVTRGFPGVTSSDTTCLFYPSPNHENYLGRIKLRLDIDLDFKSQFR